MRFPYTHVVGHYAPTEPSGRARGQPHSRLWMSAISAPLARSIWPRSPVTRTRILAPQNLETSWKGAETATPQLRGPTTARS